MKGKGRLVILLVLVTGMLATFAGGRALRSALADRRGLQSRPSALPSGALPADPAEQRAPQETRPVSVRWLEAPATTAPGPAEPNRHLQARRTVETLLSRVNSTVLPGAVPELTANVNRAFLLGWLDALRHTSSELLDRIGDVFRELICSGTLNPEESIIVGQVFQLAPEVSSPEAFECFFNRFPNEEVPLWTMLDAWRNADTDLVPALARIRAAAVDPRTRSRFEPLDPPGEAETEVESATPGRHVPAQQPVTQPNKENES